MQPDANSRPVAVTPGTAGPSPRHPALLIGLLYVLVSLALHSALAFVAFGLVPNLPQEDRTPIELTLFEPPPPPPPPPPEVKEPEPPPPAPEPPKPVQIERPKPKVLPKPPPPKPEEPPPPPPPPSPLPPASGFSVDMEATVKGVGGVQVMATEGGGNMYADPNNHEVTPGRGGGPPAPPPPPPRPTYRAFEVDRAPELAVEVKPEYPPDARRRELEADVLLRLLIGADGQVETVEVKKSGGEEFDRAALAAARRMRFKPAIRGGEKVAVHIDYEIAFRLVD